MNSESVPTSTVVLVSCPLRDTLSAMEIRHTRLLRIGVLSLVLVPALLTGVVPSASRAHQQTSVVASFNFDQELKNVLRRTNGNAVAMAVQSGRIIGIATRNVSASAELHLASISKVVTASALFKLAELGRVSLEEPIRRYLPKLFPVDGKSKIADQSVLAFLNHATGLKSHNFRAVTSGINSYKGYAEMASTMRPSTQIGQYAYSNDNYALLTVLIEEVTRMSFESAVHELVWEPLGVDGGYLDVTTHSTRVLGGSGAWVASAFDIAILLNAINPTSDGTKLLSHRWLVKMHNRAFSDEYRNGLRYRRGTWGHTGSLSQARSAVVVGSRSTVFVVLSEGNSPASSDRLFDALVSLNR